MNEQRSIRKTAPPRKQKLCPHCNRLFSVNNLEKHTRSCSANPINTKECPNCGVEYYVNHKKHETCSTFCAAQYKQLRGVGAPPVNFQATKYQTIAFKHHDRECVVCGEKQVIEVHHYNGDHSDDSPENLVPLCPTHHRYMHSKHAYMIEMAIDLYVRNRWGREVPLKNYERDINYEILSKK